MTNRQKAKGDRELSTLAIQLRCDNALELAHEFGVSTQYVSHIARGVWRNHG